MNKITSDILRQVKSIVNARLPRWAASQVGDDIVQETLLRVIEADITGGQTLSAIACRKAYDLVAEYWRRRSLAKNAEAMATRREDCVPNPEVICQIRDELEFVKQRLSDREWSVFNESVVSERTSQEISYEMELTSGRIRHLKSVVRRRLQQRN